MISAIATAQETAINWARITTSRAPKTGARNEELHLNVSAHDKRDCNRTRNRNQLGQNHDIQGAENGGAKYFGTHHIHTGQNDDQKKRSESDPFNPFANLSIEFFEFIQHNRTPV
jgi:hypothetical protein